MNLSRLRHFPVLRLLALSLLFLAAHLALHAAAIHGVVTDTAAGRIRGAKVLLLQNGQIVASSSTTSDGAFEITTGTAGRYFLVVSAPSFRQLETPTFYAGQLDNLERNLVLEPAYVRESIVVTATGTPTPQAQTSSATSVLGPLEIEQRVDLVNTLQLMPGTFVTQTGQTGSQASLFVRGGNSTANMIVMDGIDVGDLGNRFDFGPQSTVALERVEVYRGPNSNLYGAGAETGVINMTTPHGTTPFPSFIFRGDAGTFESSHEDLELAGAKNKLDYLGEFNWFQTANNLPNDKFHSATAAGNFGYQLSGSTQLRGTVHYGVSATGVPNAWDFYRVADNATQKDQDLFISGALDSQTTADWHNVLRYGATRKREQYHLWEQSGSGDFDAFGDSLGQLVTIKGANGTSATGQAVLDYAEAYPFEEQFVSDRDQVVFQSDYRFTPHVTALIGFRYEDERGVENIPSFFINENTERTNYDYLAGVHGDFKNRVFYTLGGSLQHYSQFGTQTSPRGGLSVYAFRPRNGVFSGTRVLANFGDAVREPALTDQFASLYQFMVNSGLQSTAHDLHIGPLAAPTARTYEGGVEQSFLSSRIIFRTSYFHNQFGKEIESVGGRVLPSVLPNLTPTQQQQLIDALGFYYTNDYGLAVNTEAFRAQGIEATVEGGLGRYIFLRGGYTYLDAVVQRSFDGDNEALTGGYAPTYNGIPIGALSPLKGARPFRRPPHAGFITATYNARKVTAAFTTAYASRSDDSTYLEFQDANGGDSLLLPNRNLDASYWKVDFGASYQLLSWVSIYGQLQNLLDDNHMAPIGYVSLPFSARGGLKLQWGKSKR